MLVKNAQKLCAALALGMTMAIASPLKSVAETVSYEITWKDLYPNNDVVFSFVGEDIDNNDAITYDEVLSFELVGLEKLGGGAIHLDSLLFDLSRKELDLLDLSNDQFLLRSILGGWVLNAPGDEYDNLVSSDPIVTAVPTEQPSPEPAAPPQVIGTENGGAEVISTPEPSLMLGFMTLGGLMLGSRKKAKA